MLFTFTAVVSTLYLSRVLKIPAALVAILLGASLASTGAPLLERLSQPFRDVFLVLFFVFFGKLAKAQFFYDTVKFCIILN